MFPLNTLKTFFIAAQTLSFKEAADQLFLSPSAISRQIQQLESSLGKPLFFRNNRNLELTAEGKILFKTATEVFEKLDGAVQQISPELSKSLLRVSAQQYFSTNWLFPRISSFLADHPEVDLQFSSGDTYQTFDESKVDVCIRFAPESNESCISKIFFPQKAVAVASPKLIEQHGLKVDLSNAVKCDWLEVRSRKGLLAQWFEEQGVQLSKGRTEILFEDAQAALAAAKEGVGIVMAATPLIDDLISAGELVKLGEPSETLISEYFIVYAKKLENYPPMQLFINWLIEQIPD